VGTPLQDSTVVQHGHHLMDDVLDVCLQQQVSRCQQKHTCSTTLVGTS
jgi:hypothetical protein